MLRSSPLHTVEKSFDVRYYVDEMSDRIRLIRIVKRMIIEWVI